MTLQDPPVQETTKRDVLDSMTVGDGANRVFSPDGLLNSAFDSNGTPESRASSWAGVQTWSDRTAWMWADPELQPIKARMETAIDFRKKKSEAKLLADAYERGEDVEIGAHQYWAHALRDTGYAKPMRSTGPDVLSDDHVQYPKGDGGAPGLIGRSTAETIREADVDTRYRFTTVDGRRRLVAVDNAGKELWWSENAEFTVNPFTTEHAAIWDPENGGILREIHHKAHDVMGGLVSGIPYLGEELDGQTASARNWLHEMGMRPTFGVGKNLFDKDGKIVGDIVDDDDPTRGLVDWASGGGNGFFVEKKLAERFAVVDSPAAYHASSFLFEDVLEDAETGQPYVLQQPFTNPVTGDPDPGGRMDLYDLRPGNTVDVNVPGGERVRVSWDEVGGASNAIAGGKIGVDSIIGHFYYDKDEVVQTTVGKMLVPKVTGNRLVDRELMKDPRFLRSMLHADEKYGSNFWTRLSQESVGLGEFVASVRLGKLMKAGLGKMGNRLTRPMAERLADRGGLLGLAGRTATAWGNVISSGTKRVAPGSVLTFDPAMIGWMVYHESMRGMLLQEGTPDEWIQHGVGGGVAFWAFGSISSMLGRLGQSVVGRGVGFRATEGTRRAALSDTIRAFGKRDLQGMTAEGINRAMQRVTKDPSLRQMQGKLTRAIDDELLTVLKADMNTQAFKHGVHAFSTGAFMGSYAEAQRMAMMDLGPDVAADLSVVDLVAQGYWGDAWGSGAWLPSAIAFAGIAGSEYATSRAMSKARTGDSARKMLKPEQEKWLKEVNELVLFNLDMIARDPSQAIPIMEALGGSQMTQDAVDRYVKEILGADPIARDLDAPTRQPGSLSYLTGLAERRGGPELIEEMLFAMEPVELAQLVEQARGVTLTADGNVREMKAARSVLTQVENEVLRREKGGAQADVPKPPKKPRQKPEEVPEEEWADHFRPAEQSFVGGRKRERHQLRNRSTAVVEARDDAGNPSYVIVNTRRQKAEDGSLELRVPKEYPFTPEGLHQARGDALRVSGVLKADRATMRALKQRPEGEPPEKRDAPAPGKPAAVGVEARELLDALREAEGVRQEQDATRAQKVVAETERRAAQEDAPADPKRKKKSGKKPTAEKDPLVEVEETPVPERPADVEAQVAAMVAGRKPAVLLTPGETLPKIPKGYRSVKVPRGTLIVPEGEVGDALIKQGSSDRTLGLALGYGRGQKAPTEQVVTARDAKGRVVGDIQSPPNWRVVKAARELAGPGGSVEMRTVADALAERQGLASPLSLAPPAPGTRPPTPEEMGAARQAVGEALEGRRGFGGLNASERASRWLRDRDTVSVEGLAARVKQAQDSPPPPLVPPSAKPAKPVAPHKPVELDAELLEAQRQATEDGARRKAAHEALRQARETAVALGRLQQAERARETDGPRSALWTGELVDPVTGARTSREAQFRAGAEFFSDSARTEVARRNREAVIFAAVQSRALRQRWEAELATVQDPASQAQLTQRIALETQRLESIVGGMLVATGLTPPARGKVAGFQPTISKLTGMPRAEVEAVRQGLINEGRAFDPLIRATLAQLVDSRGRRLLSTQQLNREFPQGSGMQPNFDMLRVVALSPPVASRAGRGRLFQGGKGKGSLAAGFERFVTEERVERGVAGEPATVLPAGREALARVLQESGAAPEAAAKAAGLLLDQRIGDLGKVKTGQRNMSDIVVRLQERIAHSMLGDHRAAADTKIPTLEGQPTVSEVAEQVVRAISGRGVERTSTSVGATGEVDVATLAPSGSARRAREVAEARPELLVETYHEMQEQTRALLLELLPLRFSTPEAPGGEWILPRGTDEVSFLGTPAQSMQATNLLRRLASRDGALLELYRRSTEPDGRPTFVDPEAAFELSAGRAAKLVAGNQHMLVAMTKETHGPEAAGQVRAILEALEVTSQGLPIPAHLRATLAEPNSLFVNGAMDARAANLDAGLSRVLATKLYDWINEKGGALDVPRSNEVVPLCCGLSPAMLGFGEFSGTYLPVRVEAIRLRQSLIGARNPNEGAAPLIGRGRFADFVVRGGGPFGDGAGNLNPLGRAMNSMLHGWYRKLGRQLRSQAAPTAVREKALLLRKAAVSSEHVRDMAFEEMHLWRKRAAEMQMTTAEANLIGKLMMSGAVRRFQTKADWVKAFGDRRSHLFDRLMELSDMARKLGQWGYEVGMWDRETARSMHDRYFPVLDKMFSDRAIPQQKRADTGLDITIAGTARERSRGGADLNAQAHNFIFDARYAFPLAVWQEGTWARVWDAAGKLADSGAVISGAEHAALPPGSRIWHRKIAEPFGGKTADDPKTWRRMDPEAIERPDFAEVRQRRRGAKVEQTKMHDFLEAAIERAKQEEARTGRPMPERRRKLLEKLKEGYWTDATALEFDLMLDQADPSLDTRSLGSAVQAVTLQWRRLKTIQNPKHWALNFTTSVLTNHINDKVGLVDFIRSATTGRGLYAEGARDLTRWHDWVRQGRPELDPNHPHTLGILRADRIAGEMGGGTLTRTAFGMENAGELLDTMFTPDTGIGMETTEGGGKAELVRQVSGVMRRRGRFQQSFDERFAHAMGTPDPRAHAKALGELNEVYYLHEMLFKYTAALAGGRHRGLSERDAAIWAAEGSGDYLDRNPLVYRMTTNYSAGLTNRERRGRAALGKSPELNAAERFFRMGLGSPFWMYRASMWPTLGRSMIDRPVRTAATYALMSAIVQGVDELTGGDRQEMLEAVSGRRDYLSSSLQPEVEREMIRRYGDQSVPDFGGGGWTERPSVREWVSSWAAIGEGQAFAQAPGFAGSRLDFSELLFPGLGELSKGVRAVRDFGKERPSSDIEGVQDVLGVGFLPSAVIGTTLNLWDMAVGVRGQTRKETWLKGWSKILDETMSVAGPQSLLSQAGRRGLLAVDGRTLTDIARGQPGSEIPLSERMGEFATGLVVPTRRVLAQSVEREQLSFADEALRHLGIRSRSRPDGDPIVREGEQVNRAVNSAVRQGVVNAYRRFIEDDNVLPMQVLVNQALDLQPDLGGFPGARVLADQQRTEMGRFIQRFSEGKPEVANRMASRWEEVMGERAEALQNLAVSMASRRRVDPTVFERMVDGIMRGENSRTAVLDWLHKVTQEGRPEWAAAHDAVWVEMWDDSDLSDADFSGSSSSMRRWRQVAEWVQRNAPLLDPNHREPMNFPQVYDAPGGLGVDRLSPRREQAPPDIRNLLETPR